MADVELKRRVVGADYAPRIRAERLIATSRLVLAAFSLLAVWLDPYTPTTHGQTLYIVLLGYVGFALTVAAVVWLANAPLRSLGLATHVLDISLFCFLTYLTEGGTSPFFTYFMFSIVGATLRWHLRGALWTAAVALVAFNGIGVYASEVMNDPAFEEARYVIRSVYLAVMAGLLGYLGAYEDRRRRELSRLAGWPWASAREQVIPQPEILQSAARILGTPRVLLAWEEPDEPWLHLATWGSGEFRSWREAPETFHPIVAEPLAGEAFLSKDVRAAAPVVLGRSPAERRGWHGSPVHPALQLRFGISSVLCLPLHGECLDGHLFALDKRRMTGDDLLLGEVVAHQVVSSMDQSMLLRRLRQGAAAEERIRLSRDLHDGVLQSLTGAALQLQTVQRMWEAEPGDARDRVGAVQRMIADEQRNLRGFIRDSQLAPSGLTAGTEGLHAGLQDLVHRIQTLWGLHVTLELEHLTDQSSDALAYDLCLIVQEALVNAARHAAASEVQVAVASENGQLHVLVTDNGRGFPFLGDYDHHTLVSQGLGPVMLKERVKSLGGSLGIRSTPAGARLDIRIPRTRESV